jgi:hypothetical protein
MYKAPNYYGENNVSKPLLSPVKSVTENGPIRNKSESPKEATQRVLPTVSVKAAESSQSEQKLLETRQKQLIDRLNSIKKQLDQLQMKFRSNNNFVKTEVLHEKSNIKTSSVEPKKQKIASEPEIRQLVTIKYSNVNNRLVFEELSKIGEPVNICITADPNSPPFSIFVLCNLMRHRYGPILSNVYVHSSIGNELGNEFWNVFGRKNVENENDKSKNRIILHFIWKQDVIAPTMNIKCRLGKAPVYGEETIAKYLSKLANFYTENVSDENDQNNIWYKSAASFVKSNNKGKERILKDINVQLGKNSFILGSDVSLNDVSLWSALCKAKMNKEDKLPGNVKRWSRLLNNDSCFADAKLLADIM